MKISTSANLPGLIQAFFCERLIEQRRTSGETIASYRDTMRLLLKFAERKLNKRPTQMSLNDLDVNVVLDFLNYLEKERGNSIHTRNTRLAAIRSFMHYAALQVPSSMGSIQQILAIPSKRFERTLVGYLSKEEINTIINAPKIQTWSGQRDKVLWATLYNTGARVSEIIQIQCMDISVKDAPQVHLHGKGRKERTLPLWKSTVKLLREWKSNINTDPSNAMFPNRFGKMMTRSGVEKRLHKTVEIARQSCPSLNGKQVSPHVLRHTTAMHLLQSGVDLAVIAMWLGHESTTTTHHYLELDINMKQKALAGIEEPKLKASLYKPSEDVLAFLDSL